MSSTTTTVASEALPMRSIPSTLWIRAITTLEADDKLSSVLKTITTRTSALQTPQDIAAAILHKIEQRKLQIEEKKWSISIGSRKLVLSNYYNKVVGAVLRFKDIGTGLASLDAQAGTPWACLVALLELSLADFKQHELLAESLAVIAPLIPVYALIEAEILARADQTLKLEFENAVSGLYTEILTCQLLALRFFQKSSPGRLLRSTFSPTDWQGRIGDIRECDAACQRMLSGLQFRNFRFLAEQVERMALDARTWQLHHEERQNRLHEQKRISDVFQWLCPNSPASDHNYLLQRTGTEDTFADRGRWLLDSPEYWAWANSAASNDNVMWVKGSMGTGKTTLATLIVEREVGRRSLNIDDNLAMFYCIGKAGESSRNNCSSVFRGLLSQLAWSSDPTRLRLSVLDAFDTNQKRGLAPPTLKQCVQLLGEIVNGMKQITIIIDALDESEEPDAILWELSHLFRKYGSTILWRLCLISRRDVDVQDYFRECFVVDVDRADREVDMDYYIRETVTQAQPRLLKGRHPEIEEKVVQKLCKASHGMFRWAELQLAILYHPKVRYRHPADVEDFLAGVEDSKSSESLGAQYETILSLNAAHEHARLLADKCYQFVMGVTWDCTFKALSHAVSLGAEDQHSSETFLRELTANILLEDKAGMIQFAHFSAQAHLKSKRTSNQGRPFSAQGCDTTTAIICLAALQQPVWMYYITTSKIMKSAGHVTMYAALEWASHTQRSCEGQELDTHLGSLLADFLREGCSHVLSWQKSVRRWLLDVNFVYLTNRCTYDQLVVCSRASLLTVACVLDLPSCVERLLQNAVQRNIAQNRPQHGMSALTATCEFGRTKCLNLLVSALRATCTKSELCSHLSQGLLNASRQLQVEVIKRLVELGADVHEINLFGETPLHVLCRRSADKYYNHEIVYEAAKFLLSHGADPNGVPLNDKLSPLEEALKAGYPDLGILLLDHGARPSTLAANYAAWLGNAPIVQICLNAGIDLQHMPALQYAVENNDIDVAKMLLAAGCDPCQTVDECPLLLYAILRGSKVEMVRLLLRAGAKTNGTYRKKSALQWAQSVIANRSSSKHKPISEEEKEAKAEQVIALLLDSDPRLNSMEKSGESEVSSTCHVSSGLRYELRDRYRRKSNQF